PQAYTGVNTEGNPSTMTGWAIRDAAGPAGNGYAHFVVRSVNGAPDVFAEMQQNGITVSLSNIEMARKTQAFAKLRQQYNQHD
uniref:hypothetical protein n=1 Tax=Escherichia coli TaxID=562 RepID=UPI0013B3E98E